MIKTFEQFHENDPEEDWDDNNLEKIKTIVEEIGYATSDISDIYGLRIFWAYVISGELVISFTESGDHFVASGFCTTGRTKDITVECNKEDIINKIELIKSWKEDKREK